uniref:Ig-like domain-containing protein n=1 Tax=Salarias fasciatus TaxID=181472 RepID=A0A672GB22_SALFA
MFPLTLRDNILFIFLNAVQPTDLIQPSAPPQGTTFISADEGDEITLRCGHKDKATRYYWYKQSHGQRPRLISSFYKFEQNGTFHNEFQQEPRFTLETESQKNNLKITNLQLHDSAVYLCASNYAYFFEFDRSTTVNVKGSGLNVQALVHQSGSGTVQPQGSVTLNCTIHTGSCDGEHTVYWFKSSQASQPGLIYTGGGRTKHCERSENTQTQMCVYNFPLHNLTQSHAGTYYCAVVSCGHIVFGNGTRLDFKDRTVLIGFLSGCLTLTTIFSVFSTVFMYKMNKRSKSQSQDEGNLHYAALRINKTKRSTRHLNDPKDECVYSGVKQ